MAEKTVNETVKIDRLGKWERPIREAIEGALQGSHPTYVPLPNGHVALVVTWKGFAGQGVRERQDLVRGAYEKLGASARKRISMIVALTPREALGSGPIGHS